MGKLLILAILMISSNISAEEEEIVCPLIHFSSAVKKVEASGDFDKYKHCAVSCLLALRCPVLDVLQIGILKELADTVGPGNAERADLEANFRGVKLVTSSKALTDHACINKCHQLYPKNECQ